MEIFLAPKVAPKRALTFQINVAVTNFAPERLVSDKRGSAADKCIRIETYTWHSRQLRYRGRKTKPSNDKHKEKKNMGREKAAITIGWRQCSYCNGVVATVAGRRENCETELNTWRSARKHVEP